MVNKIYFIEKSISFNANDINKFKIGGSEKTLINISNEIAKNNNIKVKVFNLCDEDKLINNVYWSNINNINKVDKPDFLIAMSDANLLSLVDAQKKFLWSHSVQPIEKFFRKKQLLPFLKNKPIMLLESNYHFNTRSFFTSFFGKKIINLAPDDEIINTKVDVDYIPNKRAIFNTRSDRNLILLLECWKTIQKNSNNSYLFINPPFNLTDEFKLINVQIRRKGDKDELINELLNTRVMLNPGHKGEVYCLAAEEARELCVPIVTMGYGALKERVEHGVTGYIARNKNEFIDYSKKILNDDFLYKKLKKNLFLKKNLRSYKNVADDFLKTIYES